MALDKSGVQSTINNWAYKLNSVASACTDAAVNVGKACADVESNWQGAAGTAMAQALAEVQREIQSLSAEISSLAGDVTVRGYNLMSAWTEPEESGE